MAKFIVSVPETWIREFKVEAESEEEAINFLRVNYFETIDNLVQPIVPLNFYGFLLDEISSPDSPGEWTVRNA